MLFDHSDLILYVRQTHSFEPDKLFANIGQQSFPLASEFLIVTSGFKIPFTQPCLPEQLVQKQRNTTTSPLSFENQTVTVLKLYGVSVFGTKGDKLHFPFFKKEGPSKPSKKMQQAAAKPSHSKKRKYP